MLNLERVTEGLFKEHYKILFYPNITIVIAIASSQFSEIRLKFGFSSLLKFVFFKL